MKKLSYVLNAHLINCPIIFNYCIRIIIKLQDVIGLICAWKKENKFTYKKKMYMEKK